MPSSFRRLRCNRFRSEVAEQRPFPPLMTRLVLFEV
jgi:hypothetical protein